MKKLFSAFSLIFFIFLNYCTGLAEAIDIDAKAYILIDAKTGQVLVEQNSSQQLHPASTTKIMTAILALENGKLDQLMTASAVAVSQKYIDKNGINLGIGINGSNIAITDGEQLRMEDLLNALLIKSANDAANVIAENISPTRAEFVSLMNKRAAELGATNTNFTNACGLDIQDGHPSHVTTASDLAKLARHAMTFPEFRNIVSKIKHVMPDTNKHPATFWPAEYLTTTNKLLLYNKYKSPAYTVTGIKTGYTVNSDFNMVAAGKSNDGMELISVILGSKGQDSHYANSKKLLDYGFENFSLQMISAAEEVLDTSSVKEAAGSGTVDLITDSDIYSVMPKDKSLWKLQINKVIEPVITAPVNVGDALGYVEYSCNGTVLGKTNLIASSSVEKATVLQNVKNNTVNIVNQKSKSIIAIPLIICLAFFLLRLTLRRVSRILKSRKQEN